MTPPPNTRGALTKKIKGRFCSTLGGVWVSVAGHRSFWEEVSFHFRIFQHISRTQIVRKAFWKFHLRADIWGRFIGPFEVKSETLVHFRWRSWKLGGKCCPHFFVVTLLYSDFNVDYDFAIKHDPIQADDWGIDFCAISKSCRAPKISIILKKVDN